MYNNGRDRGTANPTLIDVVISGNVAVQGGVFNDGESGNCSASLTNCIISGNKTDLGGGLFNKTDDGKNTTIMTNVLLVGNLALQHGGGMYNFGICGVCKPVIINSIYGTTLPNGSDSIISEFISNTKITYSIVQSGSLQSQTDVSSLTNKTKNADPLFVNELPASLLLRHPEIFMSEFVSCRNMGDNTSNTTSVDLDNVPRIANGTIDIGA